MDVNKQKNVLDKEQQSQPSVYRCLSCGVTVQSNGKPKVCPKCDGNKFFRVK
jgi:rubrerythrin